MQSRACYWLSTPAHAGTFCAHQLILVRPLPAAWSKLYICTLAVNSDGRPCEEVDIGRTACAMNTISMKTPAKMFAVVYSITMQLVP